jgi:hypothetical protein
VKNTKRILSVSLVRVVDTDGDISYLGGYANKPTSEFSIDRAHSEDCASVHPDVQAAKLTLEHVQQTIGDMQNDCLGYGLSNTESSDKQAEWDALENACNEVGELLDAVDECDCGEHGDMERGQYRYFNPSFNYVDKNGHALPENTPEDIRKYVAQDYARCEKRNAGDWFYIGIRAEARVIVNEKVIGPVASHGIAQTITSGGLYGIESDSDASYLKEVQAEELASLKAELIALGFSKRAISTAFKSVQERKD